MALIDLKSDLSWYGKKSPGPYKPSANVQDTKFKGTEDVPFVLTGGYEFGGVAHLSPIQRFAGDSFQIDNISFSDRGIASRKAQLGAGSKFPIGPEGQLHEFDITRIGFHNKSKYGDTYGTRYGTLGLADTYTANSPIDDMYDKFNLRDDATPNSYIKHPFILRGIQRKGPFGPERWGLGDSIAGKISAVTDIPRSGILSNAERLIIDVKRTAKFLLSPSGLNFAANQLVLQLQNPMALTKLWNPLSLGSSGVIHIPRVIGGNTTSPSTSKFVINKVETKLGQRNGTGGATGLGGATSLLGQIADWASGGDMSSLWMASTNGTTLEDQTTRGDISQNSKQIYESLYWNYSRPYQKTRGGASAFLISDIDSDGNRTGGANVSPFNADGNQHAVGLKTAYESDLNFDQDVRQSTKWEDQQSSNSFISNQVDLATFNRYSKEATYIPEDGAPVQPEPPTGLGSTNPANANEGGGRASADSSLNEMDHTNYETNSYEQLQSQATQRSPSTTTTNDYRTQSDYDENGNLPNEEFTGPQGGGNATADTTRNELDYTNYETNSYEDIKSKAAERTPTSTTINDFRDKADYQTDAKSTKLEKKLEDNFEGGVGRDGDTQRGKGGNSSKANGAEQGQSGQEWETMSYDDIASAGSNRKVPSTNDFNFKDKEDFSKSKGVVTDSKAEDGVGGSGWIGDDPKGDRKGGGFATNPNDGKSVVITDYKRMSYGAIPESKIAAEVKSFNDFRDSGQSQPKKIGWTDAKLVDIDPEIDKSLIKFEIGGLKFKAYLGSLSDNFAGSWGGAQDQGRADNRYLYESFERTISTDFMVPVYTKDQRSQIWSKLQNLARKTYPVYGSSGFYGQTVKVTIGDMFKNKEMIITDLSYDWDNETPWEIDDGNQAPFYTNVTVSFTVLGDKPDKNTTVYSNI